MFLAHIEGTVVSVAKHETLGGYRLLLCRRLESDGSTTGEPLVVLDWLGAALGSTVIISTDGDIARARLGTTTPARMVTVAIADQVYVPTVVAAGSFTCG
jgi:microcompartment protein CcmK/EutM